VTWLLLVLSGPAVARATRLVVDDTIFDRPRLWWTLRFPAFLVTLLGCPWCISGWIAAAVTVWIATAESAPAPLLWWLAIWQFAVFAYWVTEAAASLFSEDD